MLKKTKEKEKEKPSLKTYKMAHDYLQVDRTTEISVRFICKRIKFALY